MLLLDEPTNDLDVDTLRALEEALEDFAGCAVIISHDRWFLDRIATHMLAFEDDSHVEWFEGNFQDDEKDKMRRLGQDFIIPHRLKYKKLQGKAGFDFAEPVEKPASARQRVMEELAGLAQPQPLDLPRAMFRNENLGRQSTSVASQPGKNRRPRLKPNASRRCSVVRP